MPLRLVPSFLFFTFINGITPGPANLSSLFVSLNCGKQAALRQWRGIFTGFFIDAMIAVLICYFLGKAAGDKIYFLPYVGATYIVWLAIRILRSRPKNEMSGAKNYGFRSGLIVQLSLQGLFQRHWRAVNIVMALSLIVCAVNLVIR